MALVTSDLSDYDFLQGTVSRQPCLCNDKSIKEDSQADEPMPQYLTDVGQRDLIV